LLYKHDPLLAYLRQSDFARNLSEITMTRIPALTIEIAPDASRPVLEAQLKATSAYCSTYSRRWPIRLRRFSGYVQFYQAMEKS